MKYTVHKNFIYQVNIKNMKAFDLMSTDLEAARENATITEIGTRLILRSINGLPIIEENGKVIGILTIIDILRAIKEDRDLDKLKAKDLMTANPKTVNQQTDMMEIIKLMDSEGIEMVPVVDEDNDNRIIGVVSRKDILEEKFNERFVTLGMKKTITKSLGE
ncbi:MAG TPA: CBS domain-containing protein [Candidatus Nitrosocosmicus sp.]|nr:CBS domain-containing protein [Candidatus Nitrosocosmicus sp.]